jgi:TPR repeat protein
MLEEAVKAASTRAMVMLARLLVDGDGVAHDLEQALALLRRAVGAGDAFDGAKALGDLYSADSALRDKKKAVDAYRIAGEAGNSLALMRLGMMLATGDGVEPDPQRASAALENALRVGLERTASEELGDFYLADTPVRDAAKAAEAYQRAIDTGSSSAVRKLVALLVSGDGLGKDVSRAIALLTAAIAAGNHLPAAEMLADIYMTQVTPSDTSAAAAAYQIAVDAGSATAMISLAKILTPGGKVAEDPERARDLLERAIALGEVSSGAVALADLYRVESTIRDPVKAAAAYQLAADAGSSWAMVELARMLIEGDGVESDPERARTLLESAVAAGQVKWGAETLGSLYLEDTPFRDPVKAAEAYQAAANQGNGWAMILLARMLVAGNGVKTDPGRAIQLLEQASALKPIPAAKTLIEIYTSDTPFNDPAKAVEAYQIAADAGSVDAMMKLAAILEEGAGVPADPARAAELLSRATASDPAVAGARLGRLLLSDTPIRNTAKAVAAYGEAAQAGSPEAMVGLARLLIAGDGVAADLEQARELLERAINSGGAAVAGTPLGDLYARQTDPEDLARAVEAYRAGVSAGDPVAMVRLAGMLADGKGVAAAPAQAVELLRQAVEKGERIMAGEALAQLYLRDTPLQDQEKAATAYQIAADAGSVPAMLKLASMLSSADGFLADHKRAAALFEQAVAAGEVLPAARLLGDLYSANNSIQNLGKAAEAYQKGADAGDVESMLALATLLASDGGGPSDAERALRVLDRAAELGAGARALEGFGDVYLIESPVRDAARAVDYYRQAIDAGSTSALIKLAKILWKGDGAAAAPQKAIDLLEEAIANGNVAAPANALGEFYVARAREGDLELAIHYFEQASAAGYGPANLALVRLAGDGYREPAIRETIVTRLLAAATAIGPDQVAIEMLKLPLEEVVSVVQQLLNDQGYATFVDGRYGPRTAREVERFCNETKASDCVSAFVVTGTLSALLRSVAAPSN